jgi:hypothetical protein
MNLINRGAFSLVLLVALTVSAGCSDNNFALIGRDTLPDRASQSVQDEIVATVERVILDLGRLIYDRMMVAPEW